MHDPEPHLIPRAFMAARRTLPALEIFGNDYPTPNGTCIRDYIHVSDLTEAHVLALEKLDQHDSFAVNLGTGKGHSVMEVILEVEKVTGCKGDCAPLIKVTVRANLAFVRSIQQYAAESAFRKGNCTQFLSSSCVEEEFC